MQVPIRRARPEPDEHSGAGNQKFSIRQRLGARVGLERSGMLESARPLAAHQGVFDAVAVEQDRIVTGAALRKQRFGLGSALLALAGVVALIGVLLAVAVAMLAWRRRTAP